MMCRKSGQSWPELAVRSISRVEVVQGDDQIGCRLGVVADSEHDSRDERRSSRKAGGRSSSPAEPRGLFLGVVSLRLLLLHRLGKREVAVLALRKVRFNNRALGRSRSPVDIACEYLGVEARARVVAVLLERCQCHDGLASGDGRSLHQSRTDRPRCPTDERQTDIHVLSIHDVARLQPIDACSLERRSQPVQQRIQAPIERLLLEVQRARDVGDAQAFLKLQAEASAGPGRQAFAWRSRAR